MDKEMFGGDPLANSVWKGKYAAPGETHYDQMHRRMAKEFARIEEKYIKGYVDERGIEIESEFYHKQLHEDDLSEYGRSRGDLNEESIYELFKDFKSIVPQGSVMYGLGRGNPVSFSNCFVLPSSVDSIGGIHRTDEEQAQLSKRRGGVGHDVSKLRPKGVKVNNSAKTTTGAVSFMERFSNTGREIGQGGRRSALMLSISVRHPDVEEFATIKGDLKKVTGANISIKLTDDFMDAVIKDEDYLLRFPVDYDIKGLPPNWAERTLKYGELTEYEFNGGDIVHLKKIKAKDLWNTIVTQARNNAEPGLMFWDNVIGYGPDGTYEEYRPISSNPCGISVCLK